MRLDPEFKRRTVATLGFCLAIALPLTAAVRSNFTVVARSGEVAPDTGGATFSQFLFPCLINNEGAVAFKARLNFGSAGVNGQNFEGIWAGPRGALKLAARQGFQVTGLEQGVTFQSFSTLRLDEGGFLLLAATLQGTNVTSSNNTCFLAGPPEALQVIAREGDQAPDCEPGAVFADLGSLSARPFLAGRPGEFCFRASLGGAATNNNATGIWGGTAGRVRLLARQGGQVNGLPDGGRFDSLLFSSLRMNPAGQLVFPVGLKGNGVTIFENDTAIIGGTTNGLGILVRRGDSPWPQSGLTFYDFREASMNARGQLCFVATFKELMSGGNASAIVAGTPGNFSIIARAGELAACFTNGTRFQDLTLKQPVWNRNGHVAFVADLKGPAIGSTNDTGVFIATTNVMRPICVQGDDAPGMPPGVKFHSAFSGTFDIPLLNDHGNLAFSAMIEGPGIGLTNSEALFVGPPHFIQPILQRGDGLLLASNDLRTVHTFQIVDGSAGSEPSGGQDGRSRCLNDRNQLIFAVTFVAGQGSALLIENDVEDPDRNRLPTLVQRGLGIGAEPGGGLPQWSLTNGQLRLVFQQATNEPLAKVVLQERNSLGQEWQDCAVTNSAAIGGASNVEQRAVNFPVGREPTKFYQIGVRSELWSRQ